MPTIYVDADGCPVKEEVYRVARRYHLKVQVVCNRAMNVPVDELVERIVVGSRFNAADDWIAADVRCQPFRQARQPAARVTEVEASLRRPL